MAAQKDFIKVSPMDADSIIKANNLKEITNPIFFIANNVPTPDGLLSNEIFGITKEQRSTTFAYINLNGYFLHPLAYEIWTKLDSKIVDCVYGTKTFKIVNGKLEDDPEGGTGLEFLRNNFNKFEFQKNRSAIRNKNIDFLIKYKNVLFMDKLIVLPAFYRDINTTDRYVGVGDVNKLYNSIIIAAKSLKEYNNFGMGVSDSIKGRIQNLIVQVYDSFSKDILSGKFGLIRSAASSKTSDYSSRLVISAPNLKVENMEDLLVDTDHAAIPLASVLANFLPYMISFVRNFFAGEYQNNSVIPVILPGKKEPVYLPIKDYRISFSDDVIREELDRFIHGFSDRFRPIEVPLEPNKYKLDSTTMVLKGFTVTNKEILDSMRDQERPGDMKGFLPIMERPMTWCDLFYIGAVEVTRDKSVLVTRYPIDSCYNQFPLLINVSSTLKTEPMVINNKLYKHYPKIRREDIGKNTSNAFIDTLNISNIYLGSIGGDY